MNPCPQCGAILQPSDTFCNVCRAPVGAGAQQGFGAPPPPGFGGPPQNAFGAPPMGAPLRCQMGHDVAPGASYCPHGHPAEPPAFGSDQYGGGYGQQPGFGQPQPPPPGFGQPQYGGPGAPGGFGAPPPPYDPNAQFGAPPPPYDPNAQYGAYGQQPAFPGGQYAPPPPPQQGFGAPPPQQGYGAPPPGFPPAGPGGFGGSVAPPGASPDPQLPPAIPANLPPNALRGFLVAYQSSSQGEFWTLTGGRKTVGRANSGEQVDVPLADPTISSRHAALLVDAASGTITIEDTGSTNGTFVNEEHIGFNGKRDLRDGDRVRFGGYTTIVKVIGR